MDDVRNEKDEWSYRPPEGYNMRMEKKRDVWSLGITLIELAIGRSPYDNTTLQTVRRRICSDQFPFISRKKWSPSFVDFVTKCLIRDMNERASVGELMQVRCHEMGLNVASLCQRLLGKDSARWVF